ncbi:MAG TPA: methyltransferase, TIGR04325 family [Bryobacteraceae bacterium]|jgi:putative methyltransferase (TIGR04325 family)|nr:methyltransferase, TIGR04325 family [Bryobacteraceae bacterium]
MTASKELTGGEPELTQTGEDIRASLKDADERNQKPKPLVPDLEPATGISLSKRLRVHQVRFCSQLIRNTSHLPAISAFFKSIRDVPVFRNVVNGIIGYNRPFPTLQQAKAYIADYDGGGHGHPFCAINLMKTVQNANPSDYAALFFLQPILPAVRTVFDFGGSVGNLWYCYSNYISMPADLTWTVFDVPENVQLGEQIAKDAGENRLRFTSFLCDGDGADVFIATGALHYFEESLPAMLSEYHSKPRYVLINRTPFSSGAPFATVQDAGRYRVACMLYNQDQLIEEFRGVGYDLVDRWSAAERTHIIPCYPDLSVNAYSGMFLKLRD